MAARDAVRDFVIARIQPLLKAQLAYAQGRKYLVVRNTKTGRVLRVADPIAEATLGTDEEILEVWEKDPNVQAFTDLLNRALDKPKEQELEVTVSTNDTLIAKLHAARARMARHREG